MDAHMARLGAADKMPGWKLRQGAIHRSAKAGRDGPTSTTFTMRYA